MRGRNFFFATAVFGLLASAAILALCLPFGNPVEVRLLGIESQRDSDRKAVTVEFRNRGSNWINFAESLKVRTRVGHRWLAPERFPELGNNGLLQGTNCQSVRFMMPREAEACRFLLDYRVGRSPYCTAYFFLDRHGVRARFPNLSKVILKLFPGRPRLHHAAPELALPSEQPSLAMAAAP